MFFQSASGLSKCKKLLQISTSQFFIKILLNIFCVEKILFTFAHTSHPKPLSLKTQQTKLVILRKLKTSFYKGFSSILLWNVSDDNDNNDLIIIMLM